MIFLRSLLFYCQLYYSSSQIVLPDVGRRSLNVWEIQWPNRILQLYSNTPVSTWIMYSGWELCHLTASPGGGGDKWVPYLDDYGEMQWASFVTQVLEIYMLGYKSTCDLVESYREYFQQPLQHLKLHKSWLDKTTHILDIVHQENAKCFGSYNWKTQQL